MQQTQQVQRCRMSLTCINKPQRRRKYLKQVPLANVPKRARRAPYVALG